MRRLFVVGVCGLFLAALIGLALRPSTALAVAPAAGGKPRPMPRVAAATRAIGQPLVHSAWGSDPGQLGRKHEEESNPEGPMAIAARGGEALVLDQVNRRIERFANGKLVGKVEIGSDTVQDLAAMHGGRTAVLDRLSDGNVQIYGADGKLANSLPLAGKGITEGGDVTGVFADDSGVYVEREHGSLVRIADADGTADADRPELLGRPSRDGRLVLQAEMADPGAGQLRVRATDRATGSPAWTQLVQLDAPVIHIVMLDSDRAGNVYVAAEVGREGTEPPYELYDVHLVAARLGPNGALRGQIQMPGLGTADETFRPLTVDDDGVLYLMLPGDDGITVLKYTFP
jgi:hypothetical protein